mmetsp:Transcript_133395/g.324203  ORF Transcript_133395/g.324203 Transcript_133395/m.324203 type:complete len:236 (-) Transcript_133395:239-946(-)
MLALAVPLLHAPPHVCPHHTSQGIEYHLGRGSSGQRGELCCDHNRVGVDSQAQRPTRCQVCKLLPELTPHAADAAASLADECRLAEWIDRHDFSCSASWKARAGRAAQGRQSAGACCRRELRAVDRRLVSGQAALHQAEHAECPDQVQGPVAALHEGLARDPTSHLSHAGPRHPTLPLHDLPPPLGGGERRLRKWLGCAHHLQPAPRGQVQPHILARAEGGGQVGGVDGASPCGA